MEIEHEITPGRAEDKTLRIFDEDQGYLSAAARRYLFKGENKGHVTYMRVQDDWYIVPVGLKGYKVGGRGMVRVTKLLKESGWVPAVAVSIGLIEDIDEDRGTNVLKLGDII